MMQFAQLQQIHCFPFAESHTSTRLHTSAAYAMTRQGSGGLCACPDPSLLTDFLHASSQCTSLQLLCPRVVHGPVPCCTPERKATQLHEPPSRFGVKISRGDEHQPGDSPISSLPVDASG